MAVLGESIVCLPATSNSVICRNKGVMCQHCNELSSELHETHREILSYEKVIQVLCEELINMDQCARAVCSSRSEHHDDQHRSFNPKDE